MKKLKLLNAKMCEKELISQAFEAMKNAYAPYSGFRVGAALLACDEKIYQGCNVECASYGATICAERTALVSAIVKGQRDFIALAICADTEDFCTPCGICRQLLFEFSPEMPVLCCNNKGEYEKILVKELLPKGFRL